MTKPTAPNLPIGYWLKQTDSLITEHINRVQAANGVSRFEWQVLNLLHEAGEASRERLFETMRSCVDASGLDAVFNMTGHSTNHAGAAVQVLGAGQRWREAAG